MILMKTIFFQDRTLAWTKSNGILQNFKFVLATLCYLFSNCVVLHIVIAAATCFLAIGMAIIMSSWTDNYGDSSEDKDLLTQFKGAVIAIALGVYYGLCTMLRPLAQLFMSFLVV